jgi:hypothetical protein
MAYGGGKDHLKADLRKGCRDSRRLKNAGKTQTLV